MIIVCIKNDLFAARIVLQTKHCNVLHNNIDKMANVPYNAQEYYDMFRCLTQAEGDSRRAANLYFETYQDDPEVNRFPDYRVFDRLNARLLRGGPLVPGQGNVRVRQGRRANGIPEELQQLVMEQFLADPNLSTRVCAVRLGLEKDENGIVHKILKSHGFHPYRYRKVQALLLRDLENRENFCRNMINRLHADPTLAGRILFTDECTFTVNGMFNNKNFVHWGDANPFNIRATKHQYRWSINVWCGMIGDRLVSNSFSYKKFLFHNAL